ncbi:MAG: hypothetical protein VYA67_22080 [Actinomycetota bacterium]|nr:hypothetical protein [Actinomycetota bacterium]
MPEIDGQEWSKEEIKQAILDGRVTEIWPNATHFENLENGPPDKPLEGFGYIHFENGSKIKYNLR